MNVLGNAGNGTHSFGSDPFCSFFVLLLLLLGPGDFDLPVVLLCRRKEDDCFGTDDKGFLEIMSSSSSAAGAKLDSNDSA